MDHPEILYSIQTICQYYKWDVNVDSENPHKKNSSICAILDVCNNKIWTWDEFFIKLCFQLNSKVCLQCSQFPVQNCQNCSQAPDLLNSSPRNYLVDSICVLHFDFKSLRTLRGLSLAIFQRKVIELDNLKNAENRSLKFMRK